MRVLLITKNFPPVSCGVGDYAFRLAEQLSAAGELVTVLTEPAGEPRQLSLGLRELPLRGWRDLRPVREVISASAPARVQFEYSAFSWSRWGAAWWVNAMLFRLRRRGIPVHIGLHEMAVSMRQHPMQVPIALAQWLHVALLLAAADRVAVNMRSRAALLKRLFPWSREKVCYRPNSSTIPVVAQSADERERFRRGRGVTAGEIVIATFGLFHGAKNYEGLIEAVARLRPSMPLRLWMLGNIAAASPEYVAQLRHVAQKTGIEDAVWWPGQLEELEISRALQAVDVFVLPQPDGHLTRSSAFMAAAAHGLPVVAVRQPGGRDQAEFTHGENVWLAERSTADELAAGIRALASDSGVAMRMGQNLRRLYEAQFDWHVTAAARNAGGNAAPAEAPPKHTSVASATTTGGAKL